MRLTAVVDRIAATCPGFSFVGHALTSPATFPFPAALVTPVNITAGGSGFIGAHIQQLTLRFGVYVILRRTQDDVINTGSADLFDDLLAELRAALPSWTPDETLFAPLALLGGQLDKYEHGIVCWREDYTTTYQMRIIR